MPDETSERPLEGDWLGERRYLYPAEIAALITKLTAAREQETARIQELMLKEATKTNLFLFRLTGDDTFPGQLPQILEEMAHSKRRQVRLARRVDRLEKQRDLDHLENKTTALRTTEELDKKFIRLHRELRSMRRNQLWVIRRFRRVYDWCTTKDDQGRYSKQKLTAFFAFIIACEEALRHYLPPLSHRVSQFVQDHFRM